MARKTAPASSGALTGKMGNQNSKSTTAVDSEGATLTKGMSTETAKITKKRKLDVVIPAREKSMAQTKGTPDEGADELQLQMEQSSARRRAAEAESEQPPSKKRRSEGKKVYSSKGRQDAAGKAQELQTEKPSAVFKPRKPRDWTVSIALPGSILNNVARHDLKTLLIGRIARAAAVWCVDEIVVYDDDPTKIPDKVSPQYRQKGLSKADIMDSIDEHDIPYQNPDRFLHGLLVYADCPPYLRKTLFPPCEPYKYVGLLPPLDMPHHLKSDEWSRFRDGYALPAPPQAPKKKPSTHDHTYIYCGLPFPVKVPGTIEPHMRVTVKFAAAAPPPSWPHLSEPECASLAAEAVAPDAPRVDAGIYWGFQVRYATSFSEIFTGTDRDGGYDFTLGTSERGVPLADVIPDAIAPRNRPATQTQKLPDKFRHLMVVFGGVAGLEPVVENDPDIPLGRANAAEAFDAWVNLVQGQGSRTVRTEEAVEIGLAGLKGYVDYQFEQAE